MRVTSRLLVVVPLGALLLAGACGGDERRVDLHNPMAVFDAAMAALSTADLDGLYEYLTPHGKADVENNLQVLQRSLRDEAQAAQILADMRKYHPEISTESFEKARSGTLVDVWRFFLIAKPRPRAPKKTALRMERDGRRARVGYIDAQGTERVVELLRGPGGWRIETLPL